MNLNQWVLILKNGGELLTEYLRSRPIRRKAPAPIQPPPSIEEVDVEVEKATQIATGCVPCSIGHLGTGSGLLNEANRFAKKEGMKSAEVIDRVNITLDELNALERVDLRPEMIANLPDWEKDLANKALGLSRSTRHQLESLSTIDELEKAASSLQTGRQEIGRKWFQERMSRMPSDEKVAVTQQAIEKLEKGE